MTDKPRTTRQSLRLHASVGAAALAVLVGGVGGWAAVTELTGAVIAPGVVVVDTNVKKVQHPTGGVVAQLDVREGEYVKAGSVLVRLDDTVTRANLAIILKNLNECAARQARLEAERDDRDGIDFPDELLVRRDDVDVRRTLAGEKKLFELRKSARHGQKSQLNERVGQLREEVRGLTGQVDAKAREIALIEKELEAVRILWRQNLVPISRVTAVERDAVRIDGERNQLIASIAQARGKMTETELQIIQVDQDLRSEVAKELREIDAKVAELAERKVAAEDQLKRIDIRAPQDGTVMQLGIHTVGGVVNAAEPLMLIVPANDNLIVESKVAPQNVDQVRVGQTAVLRFSAFDTRTTPEIFGEVSVVSADVTQDQRTGLSYYAARIALPADQVTRLSGLKIVPGMPVESFIQTDRRSVISYLVKPLGDQIAKAFRER